MKTKHLTRSLLSVVGVALVFSASTAYSATYEAGKIYDGNDPFSGRGKGYLNESPSLAKCKVGKCETKTIKGETVFVPGEDGVSPGKYKSAFTITFDSNAKISGSWTFDPTKVSGLGLDPLLYPTKVVVKAGNYWYFTEVAAGTLSGSWTTSPIKVGKKGNTPTLSHISFYDTGTPVPLPAAAYLFGSALLGMAGIGYRRNKKQA